MSKSTATGKYFIFGLLLIVLLTACGQNATTSTKQATGTIKPLGSGSTPEAGNDGKPVAQIDGHQESTIAAQSVLFVGSDNGSLYAFGANSGKIQWQHALADTQVLVVGVRSNIVYATTDATLYALNATTGTLLWHYQANIYIAKTVIDDTTIYINTAATGQSSTLDAVRAVDGAMLWHYTLSSTVPILLSVIHGVVYCRQSSGDFNDYNQTLYALRAQDAHVLWHIHTTGTDGFVGDAPAVASDIAYFSTNSGAVYAIQIDIGSQRWHIAKPLELSSAPTSVSPIVFNGDLFVTTQQHIYALQASDGKQLWSYQVAGHAPPPVQPPQIVDGIIYEGYVEGLVVALHTQDGSPLWQQRSTGVAGPLLVTNGKVQVNTFNGVSALLASNGTVLWQHTLAYHNSLSSNIAPQVIANDNIYVENSDGTILALHADDGKPLWHYALQEKAVPTNLVYSAYVTFTPSTSYQQALRVVTNLGLQTFADCAFSWKPQGNKDIYQQHLLTVAATVASAPLWLARLKTAPGVQNVQEGGPHSCPAIGATNSPAHLDAAKAGTFIRVTFANTIQSYDDALFAVDDLGFRLAAPCYEQGRAEGKKPSWNDMGQLDSFGKTHALLLATTSFNATTWADQLKATAGVVHIETLTSAC